MRTLSDLKGGFFYAMHGCGAYRGVTHSNTKEPLQYWRQQGVNIFEIDVSKTADDEYVALAHGLSDVYLRHWEIFGLPEEAERTKTWFKTLKLCRWSARGLTPLTIEDVVQLLREDENIIVVFDLYKLWSAAAAAFAAYLERLMESHSELWERVLIETYFVDQVEFIHRMHLPINIIFCVNDKAAQQVKKETVSINMLKELGIEFVSYPLMFAEKIEDIRTYSEAGFSVMCLTKSNARSKQLREIGVNINNVDIIVGRYNRLYKIPFFYLGRLKWYLVKIIVKLLKIR